MERNLYLKVLKGSGWVLDGLSPRKDSHFYLKLFSNEEGYGIEDGWYEITHGCYYEEFHGYEARTRKVYIDVVNQMIDKGYVELVSDPTDYSEAATMDEIREECTRLWGDHLYDEFGKRKEGM